MDDATLIDELLGVQADPQRAARGRDHPVPIEADGRRHKRKVKRRLFHDRQRTNNAIATLTELPALGESHHYLMGGQYDAFDLIPAMLHRATPATIEALHIATLGFNASNAERLIQLMDAGQVKRTTLLCSVYYQADHKEADTCYRLAVELPERGGWFCPCRCHAKVIAARFTDGRAFVVESSANLRSCRSIEQFVLSQDPDLFQFHADWQEEAYHAEQERLARQQQG